MTATPMNIVLSDEGNLDTCVECDCPECGEHIIYRFSQECRAAFNDDIEGMCVWAWEGESCIDH